MCDTNVADTEHLEHISGPDSPPSGTGSVKISVEPGEEVFLEEGFPLDTDAESLTGLIAHAYQYPVAGGDTEMSATVEIDLFHPVGGGIYYSLKDPINGGADWTSTGAHDVYATSTWYQSGQAASIGSGSYLSFISNVESGSRSELTGVTYHFRNCSGTTTQSYAIDDQVVSLGDSPNKVSTITDFEPAPETTLTGGVSKDEIGYGGSVTPAVQMSVLHQDVTGQTVTLWSKPSGAAGFSQIAQATVGANGIATGPTQKPKTNTTYEWRYAGDGKFAAATSADTAVKVDRTVTLFVVKHAVKQGRPVQVTGRATPKQAGLKVTLYAQQGATGKTKLATSKLHKSGFYSIKAKLPKGHYRLFTVVKKTADYAASTSPAKSATVSK